MHLLLFLAEEDKIKDPETIDKWYIEIPEGTSDRNLHDIVATTMVHEPCNILTPYFLCMRNDCCSKEYPKQFRYKKDENILCISNV